MANLITGIDQPVRIVKNMCDLWDLPRGTSLKEVLMIDSSQRSMKAEVLIRRTASGNGEWNMGRMEYGLKGN
jgi:hypothetical protein